MRCELIHHQRWPIVHEYIFESQLNIFLDEPYYKLVNNCGCTGITYQVYLHLAVNPSKDNKFQEKVVRPSPQKLGNAASSMHTSVSGSFGSTSVTSVSSA